MARAVAASAALPMRASRNISTMACLDAWQIEAAACNSASIEVGASVRAGAKGAVETVNTGSSSSWPKSVSICASACSRVVVGVPAGTSTPLSVSIQTSWIEVARMRSRSLGSLSRNCARQNGCSIQEPQNSCRYMPRVRLWTGMRLSMRKEFCAKAAL